jgi:tetratricopeptide (TPR) repeat protein
MLRKKECNRREDDSLPVGFGLFPARLADRQSLVLPFPGRRKPLDRKGEAVDTGNGYRLHPVRWFSGARIAQIRYDRGFLMGVGMETAGLVIGAYQGLPPLPLPGFRETLLEAPAMPRAVDISDSPPQAGRMFPAGSRFPGDLLPSSSDLPDGMTSPPGRPGQKSFAEQTLAGLVAGFVSVINTSFPRVLRVNTVYRFKKAARLAGLQRQADLLGAAIAEGFDPGLAAYETLARFLLVRGLVPAALTVLESGLSRYPDDAALQALLAEGLFRIGQYPEAGRLADGVGAGCWVHEMRLLSAVCRGRQDDQAGMAAGLAALVPAFADDPSFLNFVLPHLLKHGHRREARQVLERLVVIEPGETAWPDILAGLCYAEERFSAAAMHLRRLEDGGRSSGERMYRLGICYAYRRADRAAAAAFRRVLRLEGDCGLDLDGLLAALGERGIGDDKLLPLVALRAWRAGHFEACLRIIARGVPVNRMVLVAARCRLSLGEPEAALALLEAHPVTIENLVPVRDWLSGVAGLRLGRLEAATAAFEAARSAGFRRGPCAFQLGKIALLRGAPDVAVPLLREALGLGAPRYPVLRRLAAAALAAGLHLAAGEALREILSLKPDCIGAYNNLGVLYAREGLFGQAGTCFRQVLEREPGNIFARDNLALVEERIGKQPGATQMEGSTISG